MLELIIAAIQAVLSPLSSSIVLAAVFSGLFFGAIYNHNRHLKEITIFHQYVTGLGFLVTVFLFRAIGAIFGAAASTNPAGWLGIVILWSIFCFCILAGYRLRK